MEKKCLLLSGVHTFILKVLHNIKTLKVQYTPGSYNYDPFTVS